MIKSKFIFSQSSIISTLFFCLIFLSLTSCLDKPRDIDEQQFQQDKIAINENISSPHVIVLGIAQDAGFPQIGCQKSCCSRLWSQKEDRKMVSCLGLRDPSTDQVWIFDATPDFKDQLQILVDHSTQANYTLAGIFLTHAHMGHYTGLIHLGREAMGAADMPVYAMPRMKEFLKENGPWSQLVKLNNIQLREISDQGTIQITKDLSVTPLLVPHRDEFSETVGYIIKTTSKSVLFIPDIDKWGKWDLDINEQIRKVDIAFLDGSFYQNGEIPGRDMSLIPHPFISESILRFNELESEQRQKVHFIHFNHTNPMLNKSSEEFLEFAKLEYSLAHEGQIVELYDE